MCHQLRAQPLRAGSAPLDSGVHRTGSPSLRRCTPERHFRPGSGSREGWSGGVLGSGPSAHLVRPGLWRGATSGTAAKTFGGFLTFSLPTARLSAHALRATLGGARRGTGRDNWGNNHAGSCPLHPNDGHHRRRGSAVQHRARGSGAPELPARPAPSGPAGAGPAGRRSARPAGTPAADAPAAAPRRRGAPGPRLRSATAQPRYWGIPQYRG